MLNSVLSTYDVLEEGIQRVSFLLALSHPRVYCAELGTYDVLVQRWI